MTAMQWCQVARLSRNPASQYLVAHVLIPVCMFVYLINVNDSTAVAVYYILSLIFPATSINLLLVVYKYYGYN